MRIVLVDPSRAIQRAMTALVAQDNHEVIAFACGQSALTYIRENAATCVLLTSVQLPDISGLEVCGPSTGDSRFSACSIRHRHVVSI